MYLVLFHNAHVHEPWAVSCKHAAQSQNTFHMEIYTIFISSHSSICMLLCVYSKSVFFPSSYRKKEISLTQGSLGNILHFPANIHYISQTTLSLSCMHTSSHTAVSMHIVQGQTSGLLLGNTAPPLTTYLAVRQPPRRQIWRSSSDLHPPTNLQQGQNRGLTSTLPENTAELSNVTLSQPITDIQSIAMHSLLCQRQNPTERDSVTTSLPGNWTLLMRSKGKLLLEALEQGKNGFRGKM